MSRRASANPLPEIFLLAALALAFLLGFASLRERRPEEQAGFSGVDPWRCVLACAGEDCEMKDLEGRAPIPGPTAVIDSFQVMRTAPGTDPIFIVRWREPRITTTEASQGASPFVEPRR